MKKENKNQKNQECIPVGCVPSAAVAVSPATYAPLPPAMHTSLCHGCPLLPCMLPSPCMPPPLPCMPPLCHAHPPLPCMPPHPFTTHALPLHHTCTSPLCHARPPFTTHALPLHHERDNSRILEDGGLSRTRFHEKYVQF